MRKKLPLPTAASANRLWNLLQANRAGAKLGIVVLVVVLALVAVYPLGLLFISSFQVSQPYQPTEWGLGSWARAFGDPEIPGVLASTFFLGIVRVALAMALGILFAWLVTRTNTPFRRLITVSLWGGFFLPLLPLTLGWILLLDPQSGLLNIFLQSIFGWERGPLNIYSYWGIVWAHLAHSTSIAFILISPAFRRMDAALEEAAWMSGSGRLPTLMKVIVPVLSPSILVATILILVRSFESFEIELVLGAPSGIYVFSTKVWQYLRFDPPAYGAATALSVIFLVVLIALIVGQRRILGRRQYVTVAGRGFELRRAGLGRWRWPTALFCMGFIFISIFLPMVVLVGGTFQRLFGFFAIENPWTLTHWQEVLSGDIFLESLQNTLIMAFGAVVLGTLFYLVVSYMLVRAQFKGKQAVDFLTWLPWAMPGVLIGLAVLLMALGRLPILTALYGTIGVLVLALVIRNLPLGTQLMKSSLMQISPELEEASYTSGASRPTTLRRVVLPILAPGALTVALIMFIEAVREIAALVFLTSADSQPLSLLVLEYTQEGRVAEAAVVGLVTTVLIAVAALLITLIGRRYLLEGE